MFIWAPHACKPLIDNVGFVFHTTTSFTGCWCNSWFFPADRAHARWELRHDVMFEEKRSGHRRRR
jgi:hypothetical protein